MERLKAIKDCMVTQLESQLGNLQQADAKELGEVADIIKDMEEAIYYCTIVEAMKEQDKEKERYYTMPYNKRKHHEEWDEPYYEMEYMRDMEKPYGKMYYTDGKNGGYGGSNNSNGSNNSSNNSSSNNSTRDSREGRSPAVRRMYMESKQLHHDSATKMQELEQYMMELSNDLFEMIQEASPEEKQLLQKKLTALANKI